MDGNEKADELAEGGAEVDGDAMAAAEVLTVKRLRKDSDASIDFAAHCHVQVEEWQDRDEIVQGKTEAWQSVRKRREGRKHRTERSVKHLGGEFKWMTCGKRSKKDNIPGTCHGFKKWMGKEFNKTV